MVERERERVRVCVVGGGCKLDVYVCAGGGELENFAPADCNADWRFLCVWDLHAPSIWRARDLYAKTVFVGFGPSSSSAAVLFVYVCARVCLCEIKRRFGIISIMKTDIIH